MSKLPISVLIPVKNEEKNIERCISRLIDFDEIIVIDSNSTDKTPDIASNNGARVINFIWDGKFPKKRNWALRNIDIRNDWVLFIDADEFLTNEFLNEIKSKFNKESNHKGYWLNFTNFFMGKQLLHGDKMKKLALFNRNYGEYERIDEDSWSHLDMEVHEHPIINGDIGEIKSPITHNDFRGLTHYIDKHNQYSSWEAKRYVNLKGDYTNLTKRQKLKYKLLKIGILPTFYFFSTYFLKFGFLDGIAGYYFAHYKKNYFIQIQTKVKEFKSI
ncbi:glycosyltransferase [Flammeovirga yaeyamensis]|uniref:Glycosyltransferase n=1 Tax=Flammeovirga yaeyamensis TaxID=367791 RepID=A0AAX1N4E4_9BACT|nr:glycosyltransferase family 2 protein [Flammeovirga yaeyamensis]MBB3700967.1 glycosyltransferase involved in cell wall biosynthesis [Flammeovirga yaeyamensis]NMF38074.1 glycosyltransferase family 2 protein [Flammeovirga yaeyamensis]QWG00723.1 glycosyltransferase [Flammeovirga yaeyamensis]